MTGETGDLKALLAHVAQGRSLSEGEAEAAFDIIMSGEASPSQMGAFLMALRVRGETVDEITGAARIMRAKAVAIDAPPGTIDTCGTGGDSSGSFNISTASALVVAGCGVPVAKHGNRALSSKSGSADVLTALGVNIDADLAIVRQCLWEIGLGFLMAPRHHSATRHVAPTRVELGTRTIFNLLGPLSSPAMARRRAAAQRRSDAGIAGRRGWTVAGCRAVEQRRRPARGRPCDDGRSRHRARRPGDRHGCGAAAAGRAGRPHQLAAQRYRREPP